MDQVRQGQWLIKQSEHPPPAPTNYDDIPTQVTNNARTHTVYMSTHECNGQISTNQTGHFPITSNCGNAYIVVFYIFDANTIKLVPIKNRSKEELLQAYEIMYSWLTSKGYKPLLHKLDNETSKDVEDFIQAQKTKLQYTPPDMHHTNPAKRAIWTWKHHFLAELAGLPPQLFSYKKLVQAH